MKEGITASVTFLWIKNEVQYISDLILMIYLIKEFVSSRTP